MAFLRSRGLAILLALVALLAVSGVAGAAAVYLAFLRDLPDLKSVRDYRPPLASRVLDRKGRPIGEFYQERRRLVPLSSVPRHLIDAFVAGEDSSFYEHTGIDFPSILRAAWVNLRAGGEIRQGASTITQQVVKGLLLTPERAYRRKIREMILARQLEQRFSKDEILYLYLNQIYFGHGAHGIGEAAHTYFGKQVADLTVSESALLAGLPKAPSRFSPFANPEEAEQRRRYVLSRMLEDGRIDAAVHAAALAERPQLADQRPGEELAAASFTEEVRRHLFDALGADAVLRGGLLIETTLDLDLQSAALRSLRRGLVDLEERHGYRGALRRVAAGEIPAELERLGRENGLDGADPAQLQDGVPYLGIVTRVDTASQAARVALAPGLEARLALEVVAWAHPADPDSEGETVASIDRVFQPGDVAQFERVPSAAPAGAETGPAADATALPLRLHQEPLVQGALLSLDLARGEVLALVGGTDFEKSQFNRVTQARRQPGSAFKPLIYGAALTRGWTAASIVHDRPVVYVDEASGQSWRPQNYEKKFYGPMTLREALSRSVNNATVHLFSDVGVDYVIDFARRIGIESPLHRDLSLALGSNEVTLLELTRAYAVFAAGGRRVVPIFIRRVSDPEGRVLLEDVPLGAAPEAPAEAHEQEPEPPQPELVLAEQEPAEAAAAAENGHGSPPPEAPLAEGYVLAPEMAYLVTDLLRAVVEDPHGTGWRLRSLQRPVAGKTGTTNDQADAWFMGFSPEIMTGVWVGYDETRFLGRGETGSRAAAPIWIDYMREALAGIPIQDFNLPEPIVFARIDRKTGLLADASSRDTVFQAFLTGTEPTRTATSDLEEEGAREALLRDF